MRGIYHCFASYGTMEHLCPQSAHFAPAGQNRRYDPQRPCLDDPADAEKTIDGRTIRYRREYSDRKQYYEAFDEYYENNPSNMLSILLGNSLS